MNRTMSASCSIEPDSLKVRKLRSLVLALLDRAAELRQADHGHVEFLGELLQAAADLGNFLDSIVVAVLARALEQLEIIDDHHADALLALEAPGTGAKRGDGQAGRVVDVQREALQFRGGAGQLAEFLLADLAHSKVFGADSRLLGEDASRELIGGHFEAEQSHRRSSRFARLDAILIVAQKPPRRSETDVGRKRALAHAGAARDDDQVGLVKPADLAVEGIQAGRDSRQMAAAVERALGHFERFLGGVGEGLGLALGAPLLRHFVQLGLGALDLSEGGNILTRVERAFDQVTAHANQGTKQRQIIDLLGEVPCPDHGRARSRQLRQILDAANLFYRLRRIRKADAR